MNWNQTVTVFSKDPEKTMEHWDSQVFRHVFVTAVQKSSSFSNGMNPDNQWIVRIPAKTTLMIKPGDRMLLGDQTSEHADVKQSFLVLSVSDNRKGSGGLWHYKVVCQA